MFNYNLQLAIKSLQERLSLTLLTILAIAIGLGLYTTVETMGYQTGKTPLLHKSDNVFLIQMDNREIAAEDVEQPLRMVDMTYKDAVNLMNMNIDGVRQMMNWSTFGILNVEDQNITPIRTQAGVTSSDFFVITETPFLYGRGWDKAADESGEAVIVLSKLMNEQLFGGVNSVGKIVRIDTHVLTVVGVYDDWYLPRKFYDRGFGLGRPDNFFIPYQFALNVNLPRNAGFDCWEANAQRSRSFRTGNKDELLNSECGWITFWAEVPDDKLEQYQDQLTNYVSNQKELGRFPRAIKTFVTNINQLMVFVNENNDFIKIFSIIASLFFAVCLLNAIGILLAKFMRKKKEVSLRRALGAKKSTIVGQHIIEVIIIGLIGGLLGLVVSYFGLQGMMHIRHYSSDYTVRLDDIAPYFQLNTLMITKAFITSIVCTLVVSIYPIWRLCNVPPASQLKSQ